MNSRSKTPSGTVRATGATASSILIGVDKHNRGLRIQIMEDQQQSGERIKGEFSVLDAGNGDYAGAFEPYVGQTFESAKEMIDAVRQSEPKATHFLNGNNLKVEQ